MVLTHFPASSWDGVTISQVAQALEALKTDATFKQTLEEVKIASTKAEQEEAIESLIGASYSVLLTHLQTDDPNLSPEVKLQLLRGTILSPGIIQFAAENIDVKRKTIGQIQDTVGLTISETLKAIQKMDDTKR